MARAVRPLVLLALLLTGCPSRIQVYAPRMIDTADHRAAVRENTCRDCHDVKRLPEHRAEDDCVSCHTICRGC